MAISLKYLNVTELKLLSLNTLNDIMFNTMPINASGHMMNK
jgi:hypothetical protein